MKKRVVVFSVDYFPYVGGAEVAVREVCRRLPAYDFTVIACRNSRALPARDHDGAAAIVRVGIGIRSVDKRLFPLFALLAAFRLHRHRPFSGIWGIMANAAGVAATAFKVSHPALFYVLSAQEGDSDAEYRARTRFWMPLYRIVHSKADLVIAISGFLKARTERLGYSGPLAVIPNGVDCSLFFPDSHPRSLSGHALITISRLVGKNGLADLLRAFALVRERHADATLTVVGDGEDGPALRALAAALRLGASVTFAGSAGQDDIPRLLRSSGLFVRLSLSEGFGNAFLEAMACGIPVVATDVGGIPDLVRHERNGLLCRPHDPAAAAAAIMRFFSDGALRAACVASGLVTARHHSWDLIAPRIGAHFASLP